MSKKLGIALLAVLFSCCLSACSPSSQQQQLAAGRDVYVANCSHCHQAEGQGWSQVYPPLAGNPIVKLDDPSPVIEIVLHGRGSMPSYYDSLTVEERAQVISYIRQAWGNNASTINATQAQ